jgi:serine/threonine protein kinase
MKQVYCVVDIDTKKKYVVGVCKRNLVSERAWEAFKREIAFMLSMKGQEGVAQIKDYHFFENGDLNQHEGYVVMEYYDLVDLFKVIVNKTIPLTIENKLQIALDCATGLKNIHDQNISHRDIKWENVFIYSDNGQVRARIGDLGLACSNSDTQELKKLAGSRMFFPPERAVLVRKKNSFFTTRYSLMMGDVWALGEVFYSLFLPNDQCLSFQGGHERFVHDRICDTTQESLTQEIDEAKIELPEMRELIKKMTRIGLYERPNSSEVVEAIVRISAIYSRRAI